MLSWTLDHGRLWHHRDSNSRSLDYRVNTYLLYHLGKQWHQYQVALFQLHCFNTTVNSSRYNLSEGIWERSQTLDDEAEAEASQGQEGEDGLLPRLNLQVTLRAITELEGKS